MINNSFGARDNIPNHMGMGKQCKCKKCLGLINYNNKPSIILDTKYMEFEGKPSSSHLAQMNLYSDIKKVKDCGLIFPGTNKNIVYPLERIGLNLYILFFDIQAETHYEFKNKCTLFVNSLTDIINSFRVID